MAIYRAVIVIGSERHVERLTATTDLGARKQTSHIAKVWGSGTASVKVWCEATRPDASEYYVNMSGESTEREVYYADR